MLNDKLKFKIEIFKELIQITALTVIVGLFFRLNSLHLMALLIGMLSLWTIEKIKFKTYIILILTIVISYLFSYKATTIAAFLMGINLYGFFSYIKTKNSELIRTMIVSNIIALTSTIFPLSIESLRGFNKIDQNNVLLAIPIITLAPLVLQLTGITIMEINKKLVKNKTQLVLIASSILLVIYFGFSYYKFKEIGVDKMYMPLLFGIIIYLINYFFKNKYVALNIILTAFLLIILPYQITGSLGILLTFLVAYIGISLLNIECPLLSGFIPIMFLLTATQVRETNGLITEFNIGNGYQLGYLIVSFAIIAPLLTIIKEIKKSFIENEIEKLIPLATTIFTISLFPIIMKAGKYEGLSGLAFATSLLVLSFQLFKANGIIKSNISRTVTCDLLSLGILFSGLVYFALVLY